MAEEVIDQSYLVEVKQKGVVVKRRYNDREKGLDAAMNMPEEEDLSVAEVDIGRTLLVDRETLMQEYGRTPPSDVACESIPVPATEPPQRKKRLWRGALLTSILAVMLVAPLLLLIVTSGDISRDPSYRSPTQVTMKVERPAIHVPSVLPADGEAPISAELPLVESSNMAESLNAVVAPEAPSVPGGISATLAGAVPVDTTARPFSVHTGSFRSPERAALQVISLREKGENAFSAYVEITGMGGWHRVFAGSVATRPEAEAMNARIAGFKLGETSVTKKPVAIAVSTPLSVTSALNLERRLFSKGIFAYTLPNLRSDEKVQVLVGAFQQEKRAKEMLALLDEEGFEARPVKR